MARMINLSIPKERQHALLTRAAYYPHASQKKNGQTEYGYAKDIRPYLRYHAICGDNYVNIHVDRTVNGFHRIYRGKAMERQERTRLSQLYRELFPKEKSITLLPETAPNLREIQRRHTIVRAWYNPLRYILGEIKIL